MSIISAGTSNTTSLVYTGDTTGAMVFQTNGTTEAMRITSDGNFLIARTSPSWANTRFSLDQTTNPAALLSWYNGYPEVYATGNSPSTKFPYSPSGTQEVKNATSSASTVAGYLMDFIAYNGSTATTAYMGVSAGTTYAANMVFGQRTGVQSWQETMRIDTAGRVTTPLQPAFHVRVNNSNYISTSPVPFSNSVFNVGSNFNTSTYRFTAPVAGKYNFLLQMYLRVNTNQYVTFYLRVNDTRRIYSEFNQPSQQMYTSLTLPAIFDLSVGDFVDVEVVTNGSTYYGGNQETNFYGFLLG